MIKIKNKKAYNALEMVATAVIVGLLIWFVVAVIFPILTNQLVPSVKVQTEQVTQDCDVDGVIGLNDPCQCVSSVESKQDLEGGKKCGSPDQAAATNCPNLCKPTTVAAK